MCHCSAYLFRQCCYHGPRGEFCRVKAKDVFDGLKQFLVSPRRNTTGVKFRETKLSFKSIPFQIIFSFLPFCPLIHRLFSEHGNLAVVVSLPRTVCEDPVHLNQPGSRAEIELTTLLSQGERYSKKKQLRLNISFNFQSSFTCLKGGFTLSLCGDASWRFIHCPRTPSLLHGDANSSADTSSASCLCTVLNVSLASASH